MSYVLASPYQGLGDALTDYNLAHQKAGQNIQVAGAVGAGVVTAAVGSIAASVGAGSVLGISGAALSAAVPFIGPALMAATLLVQYLVANSGCGQTCIETSEWANQAAAALQQVLDGYFALPAPRTKTQQALAVANCQTIMNQLRAICSQSGTGNAGKRCISDRLDASACTWKQTQAPVYPGEPKVGECWNWINGYLGPIKADPVVPDPTTSVSGEIASLESATGGSLLPLLMMGGLVALAVSL